MEIAWEKESELALKAVSSAAEIAFDRPEKFNVTIKESYRDIVTDLDKRIEVLITSLLAESGHMIVGEESTDADKKFEFPSSPFWVVDPIDGSVNYIHGMPFYGSSVGLCRPRGDVYDWVTGAVSLPAFKELFFTHGNAGAYLNGKKLKVSNSALKSALIVAGFSGIPGETKFRKLQYELFGKINDSSRGCLRLGSAAAGICYVAAGRLQAAYGFNSQNWDVGGALSIAQQAGCKVICKRIPHSTRVHFVAGAHDTVDELLEIFKSFGLQLNEDSE